MISNVRLMNEWMNEQIVTYFLAVMQLSYLFTWDVVLCKWVTGTWYLETAWGSLSQESKIEFFIQHCYLWKWDHHVGKQFLTFQRSIVPLYTGSDHPRRGLHCFFLKMKLLHPIKTSVTIYQATWHNIPHDFNLQWYHCDHLKCHSMDSSFYATEDLTALAYLILLLFTYMFI